MSWLSTRILKPLCLIVVLFLTVVFESAALAQTVDVRVDGDNGLAVPNPPEGDTWTNAYKYLPDALVRAQFLLDNNLATTVRLWVAATEPSNPYRPDRDANNEGGTGLRESTFLLNFNNVQVLGGFIGNEIDPADRDPALYETVLSGDITNPWENCAPDSGDCFQVNGSPGCDNMCGVDPCPGCCELVCASDPLCCVGEWDAQCVFAATQVCPGAEAPYGAYHVVTALNVDQTVRIDGFTITLGAAVGTGNDQLGAGMLILNASLAVVRVTFTANSAPIHGGGAMHIGGNLDPIVVNTSFIQNTGYEAGALHTEGGTAGGTFVNCLFSKNTSVIEGGAINPGGTGTLTFINCTLADNSVESSGGGGAIATETEPVSGPVILINCILWGNLAGDNPPIPKQIDDPVNMVSASYSDVEGGWPCPPGMPNCGNIGDDLILDDPLFVDPFIGNYRLAADSPCIDVGDPDEDVIPDDTFDVDQDGNTTEPTPDLDLGDRIFGGDVDMGAYESVPCPADFDGNCKVDVKDLLFMLGTWGPCGDCADCPADFDGNCDVNVKDLLFLLGAWGPCPCAPQSTVLSVPEEMENAGLTMDDWDEFEGVMTNPESSQKDKDNYYCWMNHYLNHCTGMACTTPNCPGDAPFGHHE